MKRIRIDYNNMMAGAIGSKDGLPASAFKRDRDFIAAAREKVLSNRGKDWQEWTELPFTDKACVEELMKTGKALRRKFVNLVLFGIGGSALGPLAVASALLHPFYNEIKQGKRKGPRFYVEDNVDPERMAALFDIIDPAETMFYIVSKSGETSETMSQALLAIDILEKQLGEKAKEHIFVTTTEGKGTLYNAAVKRGYTVYGVGGGVGGRFSVLSAVGLFPLAVLGINIKMLLRGASDMTKACSRVGARFNPGLMTAYLQYRSIKNGKNISVMMPYSNSLKYMADFYCQLWGESLGKAVDNSGKTVNAGQTPVKALGVTDQHSQLQLYTEGPFDKVITFIGVQNFREEVKIPKIGGFDNASFLQGRTFNELINAEREATTYAVTRAKRPNFTVLLDEINENTVGQLLTLMMYQTAFAGAMLDLDAYNQPGVEESKRATFAMLGRAGYEDKLKEIKAAYRNEKFTID